eukprot:TRINITY_DN523_c0_g1_i1.p2 TRINITY_DN523_c0_g1~~TRINITY_DN523_c0_g1_i1.p2  ORF type:complete len:128 (+),score=29.17 TRINITY_DN523_c0_g1_i1:77-460(+)
MCIRDRYQRRVHGDLKSLQKIQKIFFFKKKMGNNLSVFPCLNRDPQEKAIIEKENSMMINKFTVVQLKDVFFYQNFGETITYANVMKAIRRLTESSCEDCAALYKTCLLYTSPSPRDRQKSRMPSSA